MPLPQDQRDLEVSILIDGEWVDAIDVGDGVLVRNPVTVRRGRSNWAGRPDPSRVAFNMANRDGRWSPDKPDGAYAGLFKRNLPTRVGVGQGDRYVTHLGGDAVKFVLSTPDAASLDVAGDLDARIEFELERDLLERVGPDGNLNLVRLAKKRSLDAGWEWELYLEDSDVASIISWWDAGGSHTISSIASGGVLPASLMYQRSALRVALDVSTGGVSWFVADRIAGPYTQIGTEDTSAGATNIEASTGAVFLAGDGSDVTHEPFPGKVYAFELRDDAVVVADPDLTGQAVGAGSFTDPAGNLWTVGTGGRITDQRWRAHAELSSIPTRWNIDGSDIWAPVEAQGLFRRLRQGEPTLDSPLRRAILRSAVSVIDYWPMEEQGDNVTHFGNLVGVNQMVAVEALQTGQETRFVASSPLPVMNTEDGVEPRPSSQPDHRRTPAPLAPDQSPPTFTGTDLEVDRLEHRRRVDLPDPVPRHRRRSVPSPGLRRGRAPSNTPRPTVDVQRQRDRSGG